jgi:CRP-like cAMP-binding protein
MANKLLAMLPPADYQLITSHLEFCELPKGTVLARLGKPVEHVYFLSSGIGSVIVVTAEGSRAEAGLFGFEGYVPAHATAAERISPHEVVIQVEGIGYRLGFDTFVSLMNDNSSFRLVALRGVAAFLTQVSYTAASNANYEVSERLARWLLMCHDRIQGDELHLTHEVIALMLAVRRPSVTTALHILEGNGFIRAGRNSIILRNRKAMEEYASDAYGEAEEYYRVLLGKKLFYQPGADA